jgi:retron-type reverse transcriptase
MIKTHFPDSVLHIGRDVDQQFGGIPHCPTKRSKGLAGKIFTRNKIIWAIQSFKPFKSPGEDGIFPALLQQGLTELVHPLSIIFKNSYLMAYIPLSWRKVNVVFIPKAGKRNTKEPKSYRPSSLTSFLLKTMEKMINIHLRSEFLLERPLHKNQYAYQPGKSTETALHNLVTKIEKALNEKEVALCAFIDIEGAFDNTSYKSIEKAALQKGFEISTVKWIQSMLASRKIITKIGDSSVTATAVKGCPQGGVLSPLLWSIVADSLLNKLNQNGFETQGYADDIVIIIRGRHDEIISNLMQNALNVVNDWSREENLKVNPNKTTIIPFTRRRKLHLKAPTLNGTQIHFSNETKYLGVILDKKLTWNAHLTRTIKQATVAFWSCKRLLGKTWGLSPKLIYWSYRTIIRPIITYAALIWWPKMNQKIASERLSKVQRLACLGITGAMPTCPTAALEAMLDLPPLHLQVIKEAIWGGD